MKIIRRHARWASKFIGPAALACVLATGLAPATHAASKGLELARQLNQAFVEVADTVSKSVVVIEVTFKADAVTGEGGSNPWLDRLPDWFRREFLPDQGEGDAEEPEELPAPRRRGFQIPRPEGSGSGVIIRADGYILTNAHVVKDAEKIKVRLQDGREFDAEIRGIDDLSEVAVIKLTAPALKDLPAVKFADSGQVRVGEFAIAIGAPFSLDYTVTVGHVSAKGRANVVPGYMGGANMDQDFIQTDANINPGNSGGPLVNLDGEVMGINTMIRGIGTGIGFAIPSNLVRAVSTQLIDKGSYERAWLGIGIRELREFEEREILAPGRQDGLVVVGIASGAPAANSSLKPSDVITAVNGKPVKDTRDLRNEVRSYPLGTTLTLDVVRGGTELKIDVATGSLPESALAQAGIPSRRPPPQAEVLPLGIEVSPLTPQLAEQYDLKRKAGVVITEVAPDSMAAARGIEPGTVITDLNHKAVKSVDDYRELLAQADLKKGVLLNVVDAEGNRRFEVLRDE